MSDTVDTLSKLPFSTLDQLFRQAEARNDSAAVNLIRTAINRTDWQQSPDLYNSGKLFPKVVQLDPSGLNMRPAVQWHGDPTAWMSTFQSPPAVVRLRVDQFTGANSEHATDIKRRTVKTELKPGERVVVVRD